MTSLSKCNVELDILISDNIGISRKEQHSSSDPIVDFNGPIIDHRCRYVCTTCLIALKNNHRPKFVLLRGLWIGDVPPQLKYLWYFKKLLIACVGHNKCIFCVSMGSSKVGGMSKMVENAITFSNLCQRYTLFFHLLEIWMI